MRLFGRWIREDLREERFGRTESARIATVPAARCPPPPTKRQHQWCFPPHRQHLTEPPPLQPPIPTLDHYHFEREEPDRQRWPAVLGRRPEIRQRPNDSHRLQQHPPLDHIAFWPEGEACEWSFSSWWGRGGWAAWFDRCLLGGAWGRAAHTRNCPDKGTLQGASWPPRTRPPTLGTMPSQSSPLAWAPGLHTCIGPWNVPVSVRCTSLHAIPSPSAIPPFAAKDATSRCPTAVSPLQTHVANWIAASSIDSSSNIVTADRPPSNDEIKLLQNAFAAFYGAEKDTHTAVELLTQTIGVWESTRQGGDEIAGLLRVRGDAYMVRLKHEDVSVPSSLSNNDILHVRN